MIIDLSQKTCTSGFLFFGVNHTFGYLIPVSPNINLRPMWLKTHTTMSKTHIETRQRKKAIS